MSEEQEVEIKSAIPYKECLEDFYTLSTHSDSQYQLLACNVNLVSAYNLNVDKSTKKIHLNITEDVEDLEIVVNKNGHEVKVKLSI